LNEAAEDLEEQEEGHGRRGRGKNTGPKVPTLNEWLNGEGAKFKEPKKPRNWLGGDVVRHAIYLAYRWY
jgi:hypothetical protein